MAKGPPPLPVLVVVDLEPDSNHPGRAPPTWAGGEAALAHLARLRPTLAAATGSPANFLWAVRMDAQTEALTGASEGVYLRFRAELDAHRSAGDEVGWHPHPLRWVEEANNWLEEFSDAAWIRHCLDVGLSGYQRAFGTAPTTFRFGAAWMDQSIADYIRTNRFAIDLTLEPGVSWGKGEGQLGPSFQAPSGLRQPFHPRPGAFLEPGGPPGTLAAPLSTARPWPAFRHRRWLRRVGIRTPLDRAPIHGGLPPRSFATVVRAWRRQRDRPSYLTVAIRADAFASATGAANIEANLTALAHGLAGQAVAFRTPSATFLADRSRRRLG